MIINNERMCTMENGMENSVLKVSPYGFSHKKIDELGATEYTLVSIALDTSGSVASYKDELEECIRTVVAACLKSPRADNLMLRIIDFNSKLTETHGFKPLGECNADDYTDFISPGGCTSLYDASVNAVEALNVYGKNLSDNDYEANAILVVITDGCENNSTNTITQVTEAVAKIKKDESVESIVTILVGVGVDQDSSNELERFKNDVDFTQYVGTKSIDSKTFARLAAFVSSSISSQSQALGTNGPSQSLTF